MVRSSDGWTSAPSPLGQMLNRVKGAIPEPTRRRIAELLPSRLRARLAGTNGAASELATTADVKALYRLLLGRPPDPDGYRMWTGYVHNGAISVSDLVSHFLKSPEFRERLHNELSWTPDEVERIQLLGGYPFYVSSKGGAISADIRARRQYEPHVAIPMAALLQMGSTFVDVGASIGYYTVMAGRIVGPAGHVIACEPGPQNHSLLLLNTFANNLTNVKLLRVAVSDTAEILAYSQQGDNGSISDFDGDPNSLGVHELVQAERLDSLLESVDRVDVMKVDVEGAEGKVFRGGEGILRKLRPALFFELTPPALAGVSGVEPVDMLEGLRTFGYDLRVLRPNTTPEAVFSAPTEEPAQIIADFERGDGDHFDVMALPSP